MIKFNLFNNRFNDEIWQNLYSKKDFLNYELDAPLKFNLDSLRNSSNLSKGQTTCTTINYDTKSNDELL